MTEEAASPTGVRPVSNARRPRQVGTGDPAPAGGPDRAGRLPAWFSSALAAPVSTGAITVRGAEIAYRQWGGGDRTPVVLVHGGGAHSRWWDHVGPHLALGRHVVALDLSGHGDSGHREAYSYPLWAAEILAVIQRVAGRVPALVVAHSMGGASAAWAAAMEPEWIMGLVAVDSRVLVRSPEQAQAAAGAAFGPLRRYPTLEEALSRFRPVPEQPVALGFVLDHVGRTSLRQSAGGWQWKFDPGFFAPATRPNRDVLAKVACRFALLRAEHGLVTRDAVLALQRSVPGRSVVVEIPAAYHHMMLDQPLPLLAAVRTLVAEWEGARPIAVP